jgi:lipid A ethanolaminephosphotransferase
MPFLKTLDYLFILASGAIFTLLNYHSFDGSFLEIIIAIAVQFSSNVILLGLFSFNNLVLKISALFFLFCCLFAFFIFKQYGIAIDEMVILNIMDNLDNYEAINLVSSAFYVFLFLIFIFAILKIKIISGNIYKKITTFITAIAIVGAFVLAHDQYVNKNFFAIYSPINVVSGFIQYANKVSKIKAAQTKNLSEIYKFKNTNAKKINVILVLGESARADHFSLDGYNRDTNPLLKKTKNLVFFKDVTPCANSTSYSVPCILSHQDRQDFDLAMNEYSNVISAYKNLGFKTHWISTQSAFGKENLILKNAIQAQNIKMKSSYRSESYQNENRFLDEFLLKDLNEAVSHSNENNFVVMHTNGSHFPLDRFIGKKFMIFNPSCYEKTPQLCKKEELVNAYDNTILYTDFFLSQLFKSLENTNSIVIYVSDHGSFLGEGDKYYHGNKEDYDKPQHRVPMMFWVSDKLMQDKEFVQRFNNAKKKSKNKLSHDNVFYSTLGCSGVVSDIKDASKRDFCR